MRAKSLETFDPVESPSAAAHYIASLSVELARLARSQGLDGLGYILDMAHLEAIQIAKAESDPDIELRAG